MGDNTFGKALQVTNWGESHGRLIGAIVDGIPPRLPLDAATDLQPDLDRRKPGQSREVSQRDEPDIVAIESGVMLDERGVQVTTGTPISLIIENKDARSRDYSHLRSVPRPSHADYTYWAKYGIRDPNGGGRSSNRLTAPMVAAGAIAKKLLAQRHGTEIIAYVQQMYDISASIDPLAVTKQMVESNTIRCPDQEAATRMKALIEEVYKAGNSVGGVIYCVCKNVPAGLGEPLFGKLRADLSHAMFYIGATTDVGFGKQGAAKSMKGSEYNDLLAIDGGKIITTTNNAGGINGGISNGMPLEFRVEFGPIHTIMRDQPSIDYVTMEPAVCKGKGRHDTCVLPRAVPIVEAMAALVLADHSLRMYGNHRV